MVKPRVEETDQGIQGEITVAVYDEFLKSMRNRGWIETDQIIKSGITNGHALEIGPGPGYLGLEWLKKTRGTTLTGLDISPDMIALAKRNAISYQLSNRVVYILSSGSQMDLQDGVFDAVFTNGSLHEWAEPVRTFNEIWRVLKPGGRFFISDLRRDMFFIFKWLLWLVVQPNAIRPGLITTINAGYTRDEIFDLVKKTKLVKCKVDTDLIGLTITGMK